MRPFVVMLLVASAACAANGQVAPPGAPTEGSKSFHTAANPAASFERYHTFSFGPSEGAPAGYQMSPRSAEVQRRLPPLIAAELGRKGYVAVTQGGDLFIMFGSGQRAVNIHEQTNVAGPWLPDDETLDFVEGSVVIDAFEGPSKRWVWHGANRAEINPDQIDDERLKRAVGMLLASFPPATQHGAGAAGTPAP